MKTITNEEIDKIKALIVPIFLNQDQFNKLIEYADMWNQIHENITNYILHKYNTGVVNNRLWLIKNINDILIDETDYKKIKIKINQFLKQQLYSENVHFRFYTHHSTVDIIKDLYFTFGLENSTEPLLNYLYNYDFYIKRE